MLILVESINLDSNISTGKQVWNVDTDDPSEVFTELQKTFGRCKSKMYVDTDSGVEHIGYVFEKRQPYRDADNTYLEESWIEIPALKTNRRSYKTEKMREDCIGDLRYSERRYHR